MILLIEYFRHPNDNRHKEYINCLEENIRNSHITKIDVVISDNSIFPFDDEKVTITKRENRPTYKDFFEICNTKYVGEICIISNSDIIFTDLSMVTHESMENRFVCLSRWDIQRDGSIKLFDRQDSQDVWIFKSPIVFKEDPNFNLGKPGCDNRISYMAKESGFIVNNPAKQIITKHLHLTNLRNYTGKDTIRGNYLMVKTCDNINGNSI